MTLKPINRKKISSQIFMELQEYFSQANLNPGDRLPSERELAASLQVSRNSLREAFRVLEMLGLIEIIPGSGTYIKKINDDIILPLAMALSVEQNSLEELMEVRLILECSGARLAAQRRDEKDLTQLESTLAEMSATKDNINEFSKTDIRFHYLVANTTGNSLLLRIYRTIADSLAESVQLAVKERVTNEERAAVTYQEHADIYEAIIAGNPIQAEQKMYEHLAGAIEEIKKISKKGK